MAKQSSKHKFSLKENSTGESSCECCSSIDLEYEKLKNKYKLPDFKELNEDFDVKKVEFNSETFLRDIRKAMVLKFTSTLQFIELLLNPTNGSMFHLFLVKGINGTEKEILDKLFESLGIIEIDSFSLDVDYDEKKEAEFINSSLSLWNEMKPKLNSIISSLKQNWRKTTGRKEKSYFG